MPSDLRALGRLGEAMRGGSDGGWSSTGRRRRGRRRVVSQRMGTAAVAKRRALLPKSVVWGLLVLVALATWVGMAASRQAGPAVTLATLPAAPAPALQVAGDIPGRPGVGDRTSRGDSAFLPATEVAVFATVHDLDVHLPHAAPILVGFHEASRPEALAMTPIGRLVGNDNPTKFSADDDRTGPSYRVLSSRGRPRPASSAADIVLPEGALVQAPVTGRVVDIREYVLYGRIRDWQVVIEPEGRPDLHVVLIHMHKPRVEVGQQVSAGTTPLGVVRLLPMASHIDIHVDGRFPHVHLEVKPAVATDPVDPNEPAVPPGEDLDADLVHRH